jgi:dipeptide/tripeptide permease
MVLAFPLRNAGDALYRHNSDYTLVWFGFSDVGLFAGIVLFWFSAGWILDEKAGLQASKNSKSLAGVCGWCFGIVFGVLTGLYALRMVASEWRPERQIGTAGIAWGALLIAFFTWRTAKQIRMLA